MYLFSKKCTTARSSWCFHLFVRLCCPQDQLPNEIAGATLDHFLVAAAVVSTLAEVQTYFQRSQHQNVVTSVSRLQGILFESRSDASSSLSKTCGKVLLSRSVNADKNGKVLLARFQIPFKLSQHSYRAERMLAMEERQRDNDSVGNASKIQSGGKNSSAMSAILTGLGGAKSYDSI